MSSTKPPAGAPIDPVADTDAQLERQTATERVVVALDAAVAPPLPTAPPTGGVRKWLGRWPRREVVVEDAGGPPKRGCAVGLGDR